MSPRRFAVRDRDVDATGSSRLPVAVLDAVTGQDQGDSDGPVKDNLVRFRGATFRVAGAVENGRRLLEPQ